MDTRETYFVRRTDCVDRNISGETVIVPVKGHVGDLDSVFTLNEVGTKIWHLIDRRRNVGQIADAICELYDVQFEEAEKDVVDFLTSLYDAGLIHPTRED